MAGTGAASTMGRGPDQRAMCGETRQAPVRRGRQGEGRRRSRTTSRTVDESILGRAVSADAVLRLARHLHAPERSRLNLRPRDELEVERERLGDRRTDEVRVLGEKNAAVGAGDGRESPGRLSRLQGCPHHDPFTGTSPPFASGRKDLAPGQAQALGSSGRGSPRRDDFLGTGSSVEGGQSAGQAGVARAALHQGEGGGCPSHRRGGALLWGSAAWGALVAASMRVGQQPSTVKLNWSADGPDRVMRGGR